MADGVNAEDQKLRRLITVQLVQALFEGRQLFRASLQQQQRLCRRFYFALPVVNRLDGRNEGDTRSQPLFDQNAAQAGSLFRVSGSRKNYLDGRRE